MAKKIERIGETNYNKYGSKMTIIEYKDVHNLVVEFENGYKIKAQYTQFKKGNIISPYDKTIFNIGYLGEGKYKTSIDNEHTLQYLYLIPFFLHLSHNNFYQTIRQNFENLTILHILDNLYMFCVIF